jgi:hypothetical protein
MTSEACRESRGALAAQALGRIEPAQTRCVAKILSGSKIIIEANGIRQIADPAFHCERLAHWIVIEQAHLAVRDFRQPQQHQNGGGLAGAVWTQHPKNLAARH